LIFKALKIKDFCIDCQSVEREVIPVIVPMGLSPIKQAYITCMPAQITSPINNQRL